MPIKASPRLHYHKKPSKHFIKVYWPYLPLAISVGLSLILSLQLRPVFKPNTLAYATNMSRPGLLAATNRQRAAYDQPTLSLNEQLDAAAQAKADDMASRNYWSHQTPDGQQPWYFFERSGYDYKKAGENLAYGFSSSDAAVSGWMNSPTHRANLLDNAFLEVGFGISNMADYQQQGPQTIVVALYGRPLTATGPVEPAPVSPLQVTAGQTAQVPSGQDQPQAISIGQTVTGGRAPWISLAAGTLVGGLAVYLLLKHGLSLKRMIVRGERFILHHPLLDATLLSFIVLGLILSQTAGSIR